jgi:hypothetical protein
MKPLSYLSILLTALCVSASLVAEDKAPAAAPVSIFNGKDLTGWKDAKDNKFWKVVDGVLVGENDEKLKGNMLYTEKAYYNVAIECDVRYSGEIDSGIMLRRSADGKHDIQMQIGVSRSLKKDMTCSIYCSPLKVKYPESGQAKRFAELWKKDDWNHVRFQAQGDKYSVWLNGEKVVNEYTDPFYTKPESIGLQIHPGVKMKVEYRNIKVEELN